MIGVLGGSFDPIHFGHIHLALQMIEIHKLEKVYFCPAKQNPQKSHPPVASVNQRFTMIEKALEKVPGCFLYKDEALREGPSYAYKTLENLKIQENKEIAYIVSDETVAYFPLWKKPLKILEYATLLVGSRCPEVVDLEDLKKHEEIYRAVMTGWTRTLQLDISSTEIRKRLKQGLYCGHLAPMKVLDFIFENNLYQSRNENYDNTRTGYHP